MQERKGRGGRTPVFLTVHCHIQRHVILASASVRACVNCVFTVPFCSYSLYKIASAEITPNEKEPQDIYNIIWLSLGSRVLPKDMTSSAIENLDSLQKARPPALSAPSRFYSFILIPALLVITDLFSISSNAAQFS